MAGTESADQPLCCNKFTNVCDIVLAGVDLVYASCSCCKAKVQGLTAQIPCCCVLHMGCFAAAPVNLQLGC
jgi:hypothetical protein